MIIGARKGTSVWRQALWSRRSLTTAGRSAGCGTIRTMKWRCVGKRSCERFFQEGYGIVFRSGRGNDHKGDKGKSQQGDEAVNRELLNRYKPNKRELALIDRQLDRLNDQLENVPEVSGKVTKSSKDFPYIEEHMTVRMAEPKAATAIKDQDPGERDQAARADGRDPGGRGVYFRPSGRGWERNILEMVYLEDMSQRDAAEMTGYTQGRIAQIIKKSVKD